MTTKPLYTVTLKYTTNNTPVYGAQKQHAKWREKTHISTSDAIDNNINRPINTHREMPGRKFAVMESTQTKWFVLQAAINVLLQLKQKHRESNKQRPTLKHCHPHAWNPALSRIRSSADCIQIQPSQFPADFRKISRIHTHTHTCLTALCPGLPG